MEEGLNQQNGTNFRLQIGGVGWGGQDSANEHRWG